jgi:hypothetical protein
LLVPTAPDGEKLLMVAIEMVMCLLALLYAFPIIPSCILENVVDTSEESQWFSVTTTTALRAALETLLKTSEVLEYSLPDGFDHAKLDLRVFEKPSFLSETFDLQLKHPEVPTTCRQMYDAVCSVYVAIRDVNITTRDELYELYRRFQLLPMAFALPGMGRLEPENRTALVRFCAELMTQWVQPYFAKHAHFYVPSETVPPACSVY